MRILIISDIHANFAALEAVLMSAGRFDVLWCLGDTIGYGPDPNECIEAMIAKAQVAISGNHDLACVGELDLDDFNPEARAANIWNGKQLKPKYREWLKKLPSMQRLDDRFTVAHASPREPVWEYLLSSEQAIANLAYFDTQICFIGHSHVQLVFRITPNGECTRFLPSEVNEIDLNQQARFFINPGSVGQPRDYDYRAAYGILDLSSGSFRFYRTEYAISKTQQKMYAANLPINLIRRLEFGM